MTFQTHGLAKVFDKAGVHAEGDGGPLSALGRGLHLDPGGTGTTFHVTVNMAGRFTAESFILRPSTSACRT